MLILLLKVRTLHYLLTILLVVSKNLRLVTFAIFAGQCKYQLDTLLYVEYILYTTSYWVVLRIVFLSHT